MTVGVIGLGYVGLPLAVGFAEAGHDVVGIDADGRKLAALRAGTSYIEDIPTERLRAIQGRLVVSSRYARLAPCDAVIVCVPTPLTANREPDLTALMDAVTSLAAVLQPGQTVCIESTTYPGTTRERLVPVLEESGLEAGVDFHVAFSPERIDPGRTDYTLRTTPKVVGGLTMACGDAAERVYGEVCDALVRVGTPEVAELTKLTENIFRSVNIALVNELAMLSDKMGIDIREVVDAASTKPFGFMRFEPGPGLGGHCLPVDPFYLSWKAREYGFVTEFIELAGKVNQQMPYWCADKVQEALNAHGRAVRGARVTVVGVSYKPGVGDMRESPALTIIGRLRELGAELSYHDPHVPELPAHGLRHRPMEEVLADTDLAVIVTAHPTVDHEAIAAAVPVVDLRGVLRKPTVEHDATDAAEAPSSITSMRFRRGDRIAPVLDDTREIA